MSATRQTGSGGSGGGPGGSGGGPFGGPGEQGSEPPEPGSGARLEEELRRLESIVQRLEREDVPLDEALTLFEEGIAIARSARSKLEAAEGRIREILREAGDAFRVRDVES